MVKTVDLNCDMSESFGAYTIGDDAAMLQVVTSANIACGFHAGDPVVIRDTIRQAAQNGVRVGAHPGFADLYGFGRRRIIGDKPEDLEAQLIYQIAAVQGMSAALGHPITHVKTHGALYNMASEDETLARVCASAARAVDPGLVFVVPPYSRMYDAAQAMGMPVVCEVFADRTYTPEGTLTPRSESGAVIHDVSQSVDQVLEMVLNGVIPTTDGQKLPVQADTICVHGDTPGAVEMARNLRRHLTEAGVTVQAFV
ncbi:LamB/YcsF family protein [Shimia sediminis]|uniref:LamB/YcsF family protein n=1 Tax=Shimia sediminis TaxID=2497945 RepID=UPI000F8E2046|nr:5-oxoprolinase subunit PxpA [Shimia sediminis]